MSNLQMIEQLCAVVQLQAKIIDQQADALAQIGAVCAEEEREQVREMSKVFCQDDG